MHELTHLMRAAELGVATRPAKASLLLTPSADLTLVPGSPTPALNSADSDSLHYQQAPQTVLVQSDGGTIEPAASQDTQQEEASALSWPVCSGSSHEDDCDALLASCLDHQSLGDTRSSAVGLSSCGGRLGGQTAGQVLVPQQSSSSQQHSSGSGLLAVYLQVDDNDGVTLTLNSCKQFASAFPSASAFPYASALLSASAFSYAFASCLPLPFSVPLPFVLPWFPGFSSACLTSTFVLLLRQKSLAAFSKSPLTHQCHSYLACLPAYFSHAPREKAQGSCVHVIFRMNEMPKTKQIMHLLHAA